MSHIERLLKYYDYVQTPAVPGAPLVVPIAVPAGSLVPTPLGPGLELETINDNDRERLTATVSWTATSTTLAFPITVAFAAGILALAVPITVPVDISLPITFTIFRGSSGRVVSTNTDFRSFTVPVTLPTTTPVGASTLTVPAFTSPTATTTVIGTDEDVDDDTTYFLTATVGTPTVVAPTPIIFGTTVLGITATITVGAFTGTINGSVTSVHFDGEVIDENET